jgi:hypothetical protein
MDALTTTVSGLRTLATPETDGVYQTTDFGGGNWYYSATTGMTDNLGTILVNAPTGGYFTRIGEPNVKNFGAIGDGITEDTDAFNNMISLGFPVIVVPGSYVVSTITSITTASNVLKIQGINEGVCKLVQKSGSTGYMINPGSSYDISNIELKGNGDGCYGIGSNTISSGGGGEKIYRVSFTGFDIAINFGENYEHHLGINYDDIFIQTVKTGGINIAGLSGVSSPGESCFNFKNIIVTNAIYVDIQYATTVVVGTNSDVVSWTAPTTAPYYGYLVMRSANGTNGWQICPNWSSAIFTGTTFTANKAVGETWFYQVVKNTIGVNIRRGKDISFQACQMEYMGIGGYINTCISVNMQNSYYEVRNDSAVPHASFTSLYFSNTSAASINGGWCEGSGYTVFVGFNSNVNIENIRASNITQAVIGNTGASDQVAFYKNIAVTGSITTIYRSPNGNAQDYNYASELYTPSTFFRNLSHSTDVQDRLLIRNIEKGRLEATSTDGSTITYNRGQFAQASKNILGLQKNTLNSTTLTGGAATAFLIFTIPLSNSAGGLIIPYNIVVSSSTAVRAQNITGQLIVSIAGNAGNITIALENTFAKAMQTGTTLNDPVFSYSVSGTNVTILCQVTTSFSPAIIIIFPLVSADLIGATVITQQ